MAGKSLFVETLVLLAFALVIAGLPHAVAQVFNSFNTHIDSPFLAGEFI